MPARSNARTAAAPRINFAGRRLACAALLALAGSVAIATARPPAALAAHTQILTFEAPNDLLNASRRPAAFAKLKSLGVHALRIVLYWSTVAPGSNSAKKPKFTDTSPTAYNWGQYVPLINGAASRHWSIVLDVSGPVPKWATSTKKDNLTRPDDLDFEHFMTAVAKEFGSKVTMYSIWNEPNHPAFLQPQFNANGSPASPTIYRGLFEYGYAGLQAAGIKSPKVLMGETAPTGTDTGHGLHPVAPLAFLRGALCLSAQYKKASTCSKLPAYGYAHHAYTIPAGPYWVPPIADDVTIGALSRLTAALDKAGNAGAIRKGMMIYLTEFGVQSKPNTFLGVPVATQAQFDAVAEKIAYDNPRVALFSQYLLRDDPLGGPPGSSVHGGYIGFQSGLEYVNGQPKPLYNGFRLPLVITPLKGSESLWGLVRPSGKATHVEVMVLDAGAKKYRVLSPSVTTNHNGYWTLSSTDTNAKMFQVRWTSPTGTVYSGAQVAPYPKPGTSPTTSSTTTTTTTTTSTSTSTSSSKHH